MKPTIEHAKAILELLKHGLSSGLGSRVPGHMCVEAAVCYAMGLPHGDNPPCVSPAVRAFKITLNDSCWSSHQARATGLRRLAIAQLGSSEIDEIVFAKELVLATLRRIVPASLRSEAEVTNNIQYATKLNEVALQCEQFKGGTLGVACDILLAVSAVSRIAHIARCAARAVIGAANYAATYAAGCAGHAASYSGSAADADAILADMAEIAVGVLMTCKSPGCEWLYLTDSNPK